jgi:hypothetical protein
LGGNNIQAASSLITFLGAGATAPDTGVSISPASLINLQSADQVILSSTSVIDFEGDVAVQLNGADSNGSLTLSAGALSGDGQVFIDAPQFTFDNTLSAPVPSFSTGGGTLTIATGQLNFGAGDKTFTGFGSINLSQLCPPHAPVPSLHSENL